MKRIRKEGEIMPPFYYGLAYRSWTAYEEIYLIMPFCYIVQAYHWLRNKWYRFQHIESPNDRIIRKIRAEVIKNANERIVSVYAESERYYKAYMECLAMVDRLHTI